MRFSLVPFLLLGLPIAEIAVFILVGRHIGLVPTLGLILLTAVAGSALLRVQGFGQLALIRQELESGRVPGKALIHGVMILLAGVLLLTPGFITDTLGILLFIPAVREAGWRFLKSRVVFVTPFAAGFPGQTPGGAGPGSNEAGRHAPGDAPVIDLGSDDYRRERQGGSPWSSRGPSGHGPSGRGTSGRIGPGRDTLR